VTGARSRLGDRAFAAAVADGGATPPEEVAATALASLGAPVRGQGRGASPLTRREREVAALVGQGLTDR